MLEARPYGRFAEHAELSAEDAAAVELLARNVTNLKSVSNLDSLKRVIDLPSGRQAVATDMGGTFRIRIYERHEAPGYEHDGRATTHIPMLFSGVITRAQVLEARDEFGKLPGVGVKLTEQCRRRLTLYGEMGDELPAKDVYLERFRIEYADKFAYFKPEYSGIYLFTQYVKHRPTWYSGAMAQVMQIVGGYGRQNLESLPDDGIERARMILPERYLKRIREELSNVRLPGYKGEPNEEGQFQCDYRWSDCNGVGFDDQGNPWLLQVGSGGVFAMPLPVVPATTTEAFRDYVTEVGDDELLSVLDRFGGLPTGEPFPTGDAFQAWRRAGAIIKVCDTGDFYSHSAYYAACGWAFNKTASEGFNTCWGYDGTGVRQGHAYKLRLNLLAAKRLGYVGIEWKFSSVDEQARVDAYLGPLFEALGGNGDRERAIKYKIRRQPLSAILARAGNDGRKDIDYWENLEGEPIAQHTGNVHRIGSGSLYWPSENPLSMGALKFPELTGAGCESFDFSLPEGYAGPSQRADTIVFGCYVDDALEVVKYFYDRRTATSEETSNFEPEMVVGSWEKVTKTGRTGIDGHFYTSSFDERDYPVGVETTVRVKGQALGYGSPAYASPPVMYVVGSAYRQWYWSTTTHTETTQGVSRSVAACVPVFMRDAVFYASGRYTTGRTESESAYRNSVTDPNSYELWAYHYLFHFMGATRNGNRGVPSSNMGEPVYVDTYVRSESNSVASSYADQGDWLLQGASFIDVTWALGDYTSGRKAFQGGGVVVGGDPVPFNSYNWTRTYAGTTQGKLEIALDSAGAATVHRLHPDRFYWDFSPVDAGGLVYFYRDACRNTFGSARYANISETEPNGDRRFWGHSELATHKSAQHFIGVINE